MTLTDTRPAVTETGPLDLATSHKILFAAAAACEDDAIEALDAARALGNQDAIARCTAERDLFDRLAVALRADAVPAPTTGQADAR